MVNGVALQYFPNSTKRKTATVTELFVTRAGVLHFGHFLESAAQALTIKTVRGTVASERIFDNYKGPRFLLQGDTPFVESFLVLAETPA